MEALLRTNMEATAGYGLDPYCRRARQMIRQACGCEDAEVWFTTGGTQTNATVIDAIIRQGQGVIASECSHINVHESGAVEAYGHKVLPLPSHDGKISARDLERYLTEFYADDTWPHMVEPGMVYITFPTELGALYSRRELEEIHEVCRRFRKPLYIDGARLGYGIAASHDVTLDLLPTLCEAFYIGGTKQGTLFGEAVVAHPGVLHNFFTQTKRHGGLMAKGRLAGVQFEALFTDNLYLTSSERAVTLALRLQEGLRKKGYDVDNSPTNQQFCTLPNTLIDKLKESVDFELWGPRGEQVSKVRFVTSWATTSGQVDALLSLLPRNA